MLYFLHCNGEYEDVEIDRICQLPSKSFLLLGPRGTGKSTIIRKTVPFKIEINLLRSKEFLPLSANPSLLEKRVEHLKQGDWVYIDEIQKIPALLDEVHYLYEKKKLNFALSGSSARKLKRGGANLLAGRAIAGQFFPLTFAEYKDYHTIEDAVDWGVMPQVVTQSELRSEYLSTYVEAYLKEELMEEGLIRKLEPFVRFLQTLGIMNAQVLNVENIARESHVGRTTVDKYFEIIEETLLGFRLSPLRAKWNAKESSHPKFYLFDPGVARACAGLLSDEVDGVWRGQSFESLIINEVRAHNHYLKKNRNLFYYSYSGGYEIDLIIENKKKTLSLAQELTAIEIKFSKKWDKRWNSNLEDFKSKSRGRVKRLIGVYRGFEVIEFPTVVVYPVGDFLNRLSEGEFF
jgi:predicted AAA+ superfamily ATPase